MNTIDSLQLSKLDFIKIMISALLFGFGFSLTSTF